MNKKIIIGILIAIILIIAVGVGVFILNNKTNDNIEGDDENVQANNEISNDTVKSGNDEEDIEKETLNNHTTNNNSKSIIAYFSLPEEVGSAKEDSTIIINGEALGNTQYVADLIQEHTGADIFRIEAVKNYNTSDHQALIADAKEEQDNNARPKIKSKINNFEDYNTIFIGYPIWWSDLPQILYTFLESYDFSGKNVYLFNTNGGSGLAGTVDTINNKLSSANVNTNAFTLNRNYMEQTPIQVTSWLNELGF